MLYDFPAHKILDSKHPASSTSVAGTIAIIGGSAVDDRDVYKTPLKEMPGALIIANSIYSLLEHGQLEPPQN